MPQADLGNQGLEGGAIRLRARRAMVGLEPLRQPTPEQHARPARSTARAGALERPTAQRLVVDAQLVRSGGPRQGAEARHWFFRDGARARSIVRR